jgi:ABC-type antimicrobial peptide transport system permease subunit
MILFVVIAILLIYSLLANSVETKKFENGIRRLVGLTKSGYITMIIVQAFMFVVPAILLGYASSFLTLWIGFKFVLKLDMEYQTIVPGVSATIEAMLVGFCIPILSCIIPVYNALG